MSGAFSSLAVGLGNMQSFPGGRKGGGEISWKLRHKTQGRLGWPPGRPTTLTGPGTRAFYYLGKAQVATSCSS